MTKRFRHITSITAVTLLLAGCTTTTSFNAAHPGTKVAVKGTTEQTTPRRGTMSATSFGNYEFKAEKDGSEPMYGLLPLKFNGGYLAADILFFAPATFFNLREPYPYYEFDVEKNVIRYRKKQSDAWVDYEPTPSEADRAKHYFEAQSSAGANYVSPYGALPPGMVPAGSDQANRAAARSTVTQQAALNASVMVKGNPSMQQPVELRHELSAQRIAVAMGCERALQLLKKEMMQEIYQSSCSSAKTLVIQCEFSSCQVVQ